MTRYFVARWHDGDQRRVTCEADDAIQALAEASNGITNHLSLSVQELRSQWASPVTDDGPQFGVDGDPPVWWYDIDDTFWVAGMDKAAVLRKVADLATYADGDFKEDG